MTPKISREQLIENEKHLAEQLEKKHGKPLAELHAEREKRLFETMRMREPDRVPVFFWDVPMLACHYYGLPYSTAYYDAPAWKAAFKNMFAELEPDGWSVGGKESGAALEATGTTCTLWPGGNLPDDVGNQVLEKEFMKADEYDHFLADPSDFIVRVWLPRVYESLKPLADLPPLRNWGTNLAAISPLFTSAAFARMAEALRKIGTATNRWNEEMGNVSREMVELGYPDIRASITGGVMPPFSSFSNNFRTYKGVVFDMFRQPDKLKAALGKLTDYRIATARPAVKQPGRIAIGSADEPHRVSDEFMSAKQFEEFVWPNWKRCIQTTLDLGYDTVWMFFEGLRDRQIEYFADFPKGSLTILFEKTDICRAKEILGDTACLIGNVPLGMLQVGSPQDVDDYCKKLIRVCGKNGGFILGNGGGIYDAKPENMKAMVEAAEKYGRY